MDELKKVRVYGMIALELEDWYSFFDRDPSSKEELEWFLEYLSEYSTSLRAADDGRCWELYLAEYCKFTVATVEEVNEALGYV